MAALQPPENPRLPLVISPWGRYNVTMYFGAPNGKKEELFSMEEATSRSNFIWDAIEQDLKDGRYTQVHTRFPPEPNG